MIELIKIRGLRVPPHPTAANLTRLIAMYNGELVNSGNYLVKRMLMLTLVRDGKQRSLRRSVRAGLSAFRRAFVAQRDAAKESSGFTSLVGRDGRRLRASSSLPSTPTPSSTVEGAENQLLRSTSTLRLPPACERSGDDLSPYERAVLSHHQERLRLDTERHRDNTALVRRRLELDEAKWEATRDRAGPLLATDASFTSTPRASTVLPTLVPASIPSTPHYCPHEARDIRLSVPSAAIEPPLVGPLLCVLEKILNFAHKDPAAKGLFSGLAAIDAALAVTTSGTPLRRRLENLKLRHHVYLRMLGWAVHVLGDSPALALQLPVSVASRKPEEFSLEQRKALEAAFVLIDPRPPSPKQDRKMFRGATYSTLRGIMQSKNSGRRRDDAIEALSRPTFKVRASAAQRHWHATYNLPAKK